MKPYLILLFLVSFLPTYAQKVIVGGQYWYNHDYTTKVDFSLTPGVDLKYISDIDVSALNNGLNTIHFRFCDDEALWGAAISSFIMVEKRNSEFPANKISACEYWFDHDLGTSIRVDLNNAADVNHVTNIDASALKKGLHTVHFRYQDVTGKWGGVSSSFFVVEDANRIVTNNIITAYQYWLDDQKDKAISVEITPGQSMNLMEQLDFTTLVAGTHQISFRFLDKAGQWSSVITDAFIKKSLSVEDGLIAHYPLDGNAYDLSVYSHHGTVSEALPATDRFGHADGAYYFDGLNDCIVVPDADHLDIQDGEPFSVSLWLKHDGPNVGEYFLSKYNGSPGSTGAYAFGTGSAGDAYSWFYFAGEGGLENRGAIDLNSDIWHHYVAVYKPGEDVMLYVDGQVDISNTTTFAGNTNNTLDLHLGCGANKRQFYKGYMDDVRIYKRALTTDEIDGLFKLVPTTTKVEILEGIHVFPNPVQSSLKVHLGEHQGAALYLYNMSGKCMYSAVNDDQEPVIPTGTLAKGVYLLQVKSAKGQITFKIVKE